MATPSPCSFKRPARGLSIVELMVGVAIGLFILAGATMVATTQLTDTRRMLLENQVNQDLRATMDIIVRDMRTAGHWSRAGYAVWSADVAQSLANPYRTLTSSTGQIEYARSQDGPFRFGGLPLRDNGVVDADEAVGFRRSNNGHAIEMQVSRGNWQALTDTGVMRITDFSIDMGSVQSVDAPCSAEACPARGPNGCPLKLRVRNALVSITAQAVHDPSVVRSVQSSVRLRNDVLEEAC